MHPIATAHFRKKNNNGKSKKHEKRIENRQKALQETNIEIVESYLIFVLTAKEIIQNTK